MILLQNNSAAEQALSVYPIWDRDAIGRMAVVYTSVTVFDLRAYARSPLFFVVDSVCLSVRLSVTDNKLLVCLSMESSHFSSILHVALYKTVFLRFLI